MRCRQRHALRHDAHDAHARALLGVVTCVLFAVLGARSALADGALIPTRLTYSAPRGCPDERSYRTAVIGYLGARDPFALAAVQSLDVRVKHAAGRYVAETVIVDAEGKSHRDRNHVDDPDCAQVVEAAAFVVTPWLEQIAAPPKPQREPAAVAPPAAPKPPDEPTPAELPSPDAPPPQHPAPKLPIALRAGVLLGVDWRPQTARAFVVRAEVGFSIASFSLAAQFHAAPSATFASNGSSALYAGGLVGCWRFAGQIRAQPFVLAGCGVVEAGQIRNTETGAYGASAPQGPFVEGGVRFEVETQVTKTVSILAAGDLLGLAGRPGVVQGGALAGGAGVGARLSF